MNEVIYNTLKSKDFIIKEFLIKIIVELKLSLNDALLLIYFCNQVYPSLDIENIKKTIYLNEEEIMESFTKLSSIKLITVTVKKDDDGKRIEEISLDNLYKEATSSLLDTSKKEDKKGIFKLFEREYARPLSTNEYQIIEKWLSEYSYDLIKEALKDSLYNGYKSLRNVGSRLEMYKEKDIKTKSELIKDIKKSNDEELFDCNWLDDDE